MLQPFQLNEFSVWLVFFIISLIIPLMIVWYTKKIVYFPLFFIFTSFFFNTMAMQVFSQIILTVFLVFFLFEPRQRNRLTLVNILLVLLLFGVKFHNQEFVFLIGVLFIEFLVFIKFVAVKEILENPDLHGVLGCGLLPTGGVIKISSLASSVRDPMAQNAAGTLISFIYYFYSFFIENMFIGFVIPAVYYIFKTQWLRAISYFLFIIIGAIGGWIFLNFEIWYITRVLIWLPIVLFVPFMRWLETQNKNTKIIYGILGTGYFLFNFWYFLHRLQELGCGIANV